MSKESKESTKDFIKAVNYDKWQRIKRHPDYKRSYRKIKELNTKEGELQKKLDQILRGKLIIKSRPAELSKELEETQKQRKDLEDQTLKKFKLRMLLDPDAVYPANSKLFSETLVLEGTPAVEIISKGSKKLEDMLVAHEADSWETIDQLPDNWEVLDAVDIWLKDGRYLTLQIDVTRTKREISKIISTILDMIKTKWGRSHFEKRLKYYKVFDMREKLPPEPYEKIAFELYPEEAKDNLKRAVNKVTKERTMAARLILGEDYDPEKFKKREIMIEDLLKKCSTCPNHPDRGGTCSKLCPEIEAYLKQGEAYQRETLPRKPLDTRI